MSNPWIAQQREAAFRAELNQPAVWINVAAMLLSEGSPLQSCESLFNRVMYVRSHGTAQSLMQMISSGFYGPYNRGEYPALIAQIRASQTLVDRFNTAIEGAMAGSDTIHGFTDQGLPSDPNGGHQPQIILYGNVFNDWGGGPGSWPAATQWRVKFEATAAAPPAPAPVPTPLPPPPSPIPTPLPPAPPVTMPTDAAYLPFIAMLKAAGQWPSVDISVPASVTVTLNGKVVQQGE